MHSHVRVHDFSKQNYWLQRPMSDACQCEGPEPWCCWSS